MREGQFDLKIPRVFYLRTGCSRVACPLGLGIGWGVVSERYPVGLAYVDPSSSSARSGVYVLFQTSASLTPATLLKRGRDAALCIVGGGRTLGVISMRQQLLLHK